MTDFELAGLRARRRRIAAATWAASTLQVFSAWTVAAAAGWGIVPGRWLFLIWPTAAAVAAGCWRAKLRDAENWRLAATALTSAAALTAAMDTASRPEAERLARPARGPQAQLAPVPLARRGPVGRLRWRRRLSRRRPGRR